MVDTKFNELQAAIQITMSRLSNGEPVQIDEKWIEEAGEAVKDALRKQLTPRDKEFRLRMSNIGRPLCQLQKEKEQAPRTRRPYNYIGKMILGDLHEIVMNVFIKAAKVNVTGTKTQVSMQVGDTLVLGEDDLEIENKVWDIKSSSNWAYNNKWAHGWNEVYDSDTFGYVEQLYGYAKAQNKEAGGWIVINKETGELLVVPAKPTKEQLAEIEENIKFTEKALSSNMPFKRCFVDEAETFYKKPTGNRVLPIPCTYCDFIKSCWPNAVLKRQALSKAQNPKSVWYSEYKEQNNELLPEPVQS